jgi:hypothetical protein
MEKVIIVPEKVDDLYGLYVDLRRGEFDVQNVGADAKGTYVYMSEAETKDPVPVVRSWLGKNAPEPSMSLKKKRAKEFEEILEKENKAKEARLAEEAKKLEAAAVEASGGMEILGMNPDPSGTPVAFPDNSGDVVGELLHGQVNGSNDSIFKRIWKKLF